MVVEFWDKWLASSHKGDPNFEKHSFHCHLGTKRLTPRSDVRPKSAGILGALFA